MAPRKGTCLWSKRHATALSERVCRDRWSPVSWRWADAREAGAQRGPSPPVNAASFREGPVNATQDYICYTESGSTISVSVTDCMRIVLRSRVRRETGVACMRLHTWYYGRHRIDQM